MSVPEDSAWTDIYDLIKGLYSWTCVSECL